MNVAAQAPMFTNYRTHEQFSVGNLTPGSETLVSRLIGWQLKVNVTEFDGTECHSLTVTGDTHIGGVIFQLVEQLSHIKNDWSHFALWWPEKKQWLTKTKMTLDQYGVQGNFT
jgi:TPP-dependent trihydroxycyclohexane-1,2-dione (THcHDO) dehydratase